ncbi:hypothetical protein OS121_22490 [Mycolicibacterium mucogenicum]|uniref:Vmc-like lipoprotein signal peptide domain-containing protein n=1 Tax=Mycolicibacterium mucogenicum TaxID=56689 RepID=UPI00226A42C7|nr:hypothetical protein [Mycolicibacterium mucogenicum]MCX8557823.1 hypothetical protein [Mycolicibacterium mucogenicum]
MTQPPTWGAPPPQQPGGWQGQPGPGGQWGPQQPWPAPVPPKKGGAGKWAIGAVSLVAVIAVTAVVAVSCTKNSGDSNGGGGGGTSAAPSDVASANDKGPVGIITEDPSCAPWTPITNTLAGVEGNGWLQRDPSIPVGAWTPEARVQYEAVGKAMRNAADQAVPLSKMTTHRVMREMYGQFIAYSRAYADSLITYTAVDDHLASVASTASLVITYVCGAVISGAAEARASLVSAQAPPASVAPIGDLSNPQRLFDTPDPVCSELSPTLQQLLQNPAFKNWVNGDPSIPAASLPPDQQAFADAVAPVMTSTADALEKLAKKSSNPMVQDFIQLGVQYRRTFVQALATYQANDQDIYLAGQYAPGVVSMACRYAAS